VSVFAKELMQFFLKPLNLTYGQDIFGGWKAKVDRMLFIHTDKYLKNFVDLQFSLSEIIDWEDLLGIPSLANGNKDELKKESGVKAWQPFLKIFIEFAFVVLGKDPAKEFTEQNDDDDFVETSVKKTTNKKVAYKKREKVPAEPEGRSKNSKNGGVDDDLQLGLALSISVC
jgi:hypothetical protein